MNNIECLIKKLCPNGVEYKELGEVGTIFSGLKGKTKDNFDSNEAKNYYVPYMNIFKNPEIDIKNLCKVLIYENEKQNKLVYGDIIFTGSSEILEEVGQSSVLTTKPIIDIYLNSFCFAIRINELNLLIPNFSKHLFRSKYLRKQIIKCASGVTRFNISKKKIIRIKIPIPPLEIQEKIVNILDKFSELSNEINNGLPLEIELRKKQYEYYRNYLLDFSESRERERERERINMIGTKRSSQY